MDVGSAITNENGPAACVDNIAPYLPSPPFGLPWGRDTLFIILVGENLCNHFLPKFIIILTH